MTLEELLQALGQLPEGQKFVDALKAAIAAKDAEIVQKTNQYKTASKAQKDAEAKLQAANERLAKFQEHIDIDLETEDLDAALEEWKSKQLEQAKAGGATPPEIAQLQKDMSKLQRELKKAVEAQAAAEKKASEETAKRQNSERTRALLGALTEGKAIKPEQLIKVLADRVKVTDDDSLVFLKEDGEESSVADGVKSWLEANPEFLINNQIPGGGSANGGGKGAQAGSFGKELAKGASVEQTPAMQKAQETYFGKGA
ncbi:hypothetical protein EDC14_1004175 [Hydrogenispora ethanolica]|uniref:Minor structural protein GP20 n=1 Tax=Hydrogenispora ethanolica TaxID=1082276 RepID=A0A4V2QG31_HYDET|nr:hypothetical protein EDC14_1004175 [Hydrogenispora ethanolica]